jgi:hypothetical protein
VYFCGLISNNLKMASEQTPEEIKAEFCESMGPELGASYYVLYNDVVWLHMKWKEYRELYGESEARINLLNESASAFFYVVERVLWENILLHMCRLTDRETTNRSKNHTHTNLSLDYLANSIDVMPFKDMLKESLYKAEQDTSFARVWRNKRLAHRDLDHSLERSVEPLPPVSRLDIENALLSIRKVMNMIHNHYLSKEVGFEYVTSSGTADTLIYFLRVARQSIEARKDRLLKGEPLPGDFVEPPAA